MSPIALHPKGPLSILSAVVCLLCLLGVYAPAQSNSAHKDEVFGGYSWLAPNGYGDQNYKINNIAAGFDASNTYYFCLHCNFGFLIDGSGHFHGGTSPVNPVNNGNSGTSVGYVLGGFQYKWHRDTLSPFVRAFVGGADISPDCCGGTRWNVAGGAGGGLDLTLSHRLSLRLIQADYIYSNYDHIFPSGHSTVWNSARLASGLVFGFGDCYTPPLSCTASAAPTEVWAGDPVKVTTQGTNFNPKHNIIYGWSTTGGTLSSTKTQNADIDTSGLAPGSYTATSTITDPKLKKMNSATCVTPPFVVRQPKPPHAVCSANPTTITPGQSSTITMTATDPQEWPLTYDWTTSGGTLSGSGTSVTVTATDADAGKTITVTGKVTDARAAMSDSCPINVNVLPIAGPPCVNIQDWGECTFEKNRKKPWRVDNDCKDTLDKIALRLQQAPNGKLEVVGYTDEKEAAKNPTLAAQRAANIKYYLTTDRPDKIDGSRIQVRQGGAKGQAAHFYFVPDGTLCEGQVEDGTVFEETVVQPRSSAPWHPEKEKKAKEKPVTGQ